MAFGRLERSAAARPIGEINMTPLIDVMLVLLVIFIIAAPLMASSLRLDLPRTDAGSTRQGPVVLRVAIDAAGVLYLDDQPIAPASLAERAREAARRQPSAEVQLRADSRVPYGRVAELLALVQREGLLRVGLVVDASDAGIEAAPARSRSLQ